MSVRVLQDADTDDCIFAKRPEKLGRVGRVAALVTNFYAASYEKVPAQLYHHDVCVYRTKWFPDEDHPEGGASAS